MGKRTSGYIKERHKHNAIKPAIAPDFMNLTMDEKAK